MIKNWDVQNIKRDIDRIYLAESDPNMDGFIKPVVEKPKADVIVLRYKRMIANKRLWEKKLKFSSTKYKKYTKLVKTYEKKYPERIASVRG